jgi:glycosyltransferase involved in cell wall biosynthesis
MNESIAVIMPVFKRDDLLAKTVETYKRFMPKDWLLIIGDQDPTETKLHQYSAPNIYYCGLPFDCGVSFARNRLIEEAQDLGFEYGLLSADSIPLTKTPDLTPYIEFLKMDPNNGIIGFPTSDNLKKEDLWNANLSINEEGIHLWPANEYTEFNGIKYKKCQIVSNFFLFKLQVFIDCPYPEEFKMGEHELGFLNIMQKTLYKVFWTNYRFADYQNVRPSDYKQYRDRLYSIYIPLLKQQLKIRNWILYHNK